MRQIFARNNAGFTVAELITVMAILSVLAAIAIPVTLNQRNSATEATLRADLTIAVAKTQEFLTSVNGVPPNDVFITTTDDTWSAVDAEGNTLDTATLSGSTDLTGEIFTDGSWCIANYDTTSGQGFRYQSTTGEIEADQFCSGQPLGGIGTAIATDDLVLPGQVSAISIDTETEYALDITWTGATNATNYTVVVTGQTSTTTSDTSVALTGLLPGSTTVSIYATNDQGAGQPVNTTTTITGQTELEILTDRVTDAESDLDDALSRISALENQ